MAQYLEHSKMTTLEITPSSVLIDDAIHIRASGLPSSQPITLVARVSEGGVKFDSHFESYAHYVTSSSGDVVLSRDASTGGSYTGLEPMGLFWSMVQSPGQLSGLRLSKKDVTTPYKTEISLYSGHLTCAECSKQEPLARKCVDRYYLAEGVERIPIRHERIEATLFVPKGVGPHPGVVDLFGTVGGLVEHRSALLASRGIASLALAYYWPKTKGITQDIEYFEEASEILLSHPRVSSAGFGVIGVSKGADIALLLGSVLPKVNAVIAINGMPCPLSCDHTYKGETFKFLDVRSPEGWEVITYEGLQNVPDSHALYQVPEELIIPVERSKGTKFLLVHCADDLCTPYSATTTAIPDRLRKHGRAGDCEVLLLPDAGHLLEPPHTPLFRSTYHGALKTLVVWGGQPKPHARAQEIAWPRMQQFIRDNVKIPSGQYQLPASKL